jgi:hypothetical protein
VQIVSRQFELVPSGKLQQQKLIHDLFSKPFIYSALLTNLLENPLPSNSCLDLPMLANISIGAIRVRDNLLFGHAETSEINSTDIKLPGSHAQPAAAEQ